MRVERILHYRTKQLLLIGGSQGALPNKHRSECTHATAVIQEARSERPVAEAQGAARRERHITDHPDTGARSEGVDDALASVATERAPTKQQSRTQKPSKAKKGYDFGI